ncbi:MAG: class I SAM-dependent methyltransferase [Candidatus Dormibacteraeota bacterium]|nr:class I SAM-dependent methyltransferase [Candidatus Dormibacteraeota bacterium]
MSERAVSELFGEVADRYHSSRPRYPAAVFDQFLEVSGLGAGDPVLEVGMGTGIATQELVRRGLYVTGLEPSPEMMAVAQEGLGPTGRLRAVASSFEDWRPDRADFGAVISAQAWHWVDPEIRYGKAAAVLAPGGWLALIWNRSTGGDAEVRARLDGVYTRLAPDLTGRAPGELDLDRRGEIVASRRFREPRLERFTFELHYGARAYAELVATQSDHRRLPASRRHLLLAAIEEVIDAAGGSYLVTWESRLYLAQRLEAPGDFP